MPTKARRGYRSILVHIPVAEYGTLEGIAAENFRSIEQQASAMLSADIRDMGEQALTAATSANGSLEAEIEDRAAWSDPESVEVAPAE